MNKGDTVKIKAVVKGGSYSGNTRTIKRYSEPKGLERTGVVLGYSFIRTGTINRDGFSFYDDPPYLIIDKSHKVVVVEPLNRRNYYPKKLQDTNYYLKPVRCFEDDLEIIK